MAVTISTLCKKDGKTCPGYTSFLKAISVLFSLITEANVKELDTRCSELGEGKEVEEQSSDPCMGLPARSTSGASDAEPLMQTPENRIG